MCVLMTGSLVSLSMRMGGSRQEQRKCSPIKGLSVVEIFVYVTAIREEFSPSAELYGLPNRVRINFSSLLKENRRTANMRSSSSCESPILRNPIV